MVTKEEWAAQIAAEQSETRQIAQGIMDGIWRFLEAHPEQKQACIEAFSQPNFKLMLKAYRELNEVMDFAGWIKANKWDISDRDFFDLLGSTLYERYGADSPLPVAWDD